MILDAGDTGRLDAILVDRLTKHEISRFVW